MATTLDEFIERHFPAGKWPEYPFRKGSKLVPVDRDQAANLHALIPEWAGDWLNFAGAIKKHAGYGLQELRGVPMSIVSSAVASAAQDILERRISRGLAVGGSVGTSVATFTQFTLSEPDTLPMGDEVGSYADSPMAVAKRLSMRGRIAVLVLKANRATAVAYAMNRDELRDETKMFDPETGNSIRKVLEELDRNGLKDSCNKGIYLTDPGVAVAECIENDIDMSNVVAQINRRYGHAVRTNSAQ